MYYFLSLGNCLALSSATVIKLKIIIYLIMPLRFRLNHMGLLQTQLTRQRSLRWL